MKRSYIFSIIFLCIAYFATVLLNINISSNQGICSGAVSCSAVQNSIYSTIFGISVHHIGLIALFVLTMLTIIVSYNNNKIFKLIVKTCFWIAAIGASYFLYIQVEIIKELCLYCLIIDSSIILASLGILK